MEATEEKESFFRKYFFPRRNYFVTPVIFFINLILFIVVAIADQTVWIPSGETILKLGGDNPALTLDGQWWRTVTACFLHFGIIHFASNMFALVQLGLALERFIGSARFALCYLLCGVAGNVTSNWWHTEPIIGAGASGAVFGLLGLFLALVTTEFVQKEARWPMFKSIGQSVLINLVISLQFNFNNAAHIGGLIAGIFCGYLIWVLYKIVNKYRTQAFYLVTALLTAALVLVVLPLLPKDAVKLKELFDRIEAEEENVIAQFNARVNSQRIVLSDSLTYVAEWNRMEQLTNGITQFKMSSTLKQYHEYYRKKIQLRKKQALLLTYINSGYTQKAKELKEVEAKLNELNEQQ